MRRLTTAAALFLIAATASAATPLVRATNIDTTLAAGGSDEYALQLQRGESADVVVHQRGVDVVVDVRNPGGTLIDSVDGPTGRDGDERVEILADASGTYRLTVRGFDANEHGRYVVEVKAIRSVAETRSLLAQRAAARKEASGWLRPQTDVLSAKYDGPVIARLARAQVIGLGEATHGSREFGDARFGITRTLIEQYGFRFVAVEWSASQIDALQPYLAGANVVRQPESGWIGRRTMHRLVDYLREWNIGHPNDRVALIGVDAQDNADARATLASFVRDAYGSGVGSGWAAALQDLSAADEQSAVFGDSSIAPSTRQTIFALRALLDLDDAILERQFGGAAVARAKRAASILAQFADYNSSTNDPATHSRDWYMAVNILSAVRPGRHGVYWAHNAHVAAPQTGRTAGGVLRTALGCEYAPVAITFGQGAFIAQLPNDLTDRVESFRLTSAADESIESVMREVAPGTLIASWDCNPTAAPPWLERSHPMHWVGGIYAPNTLPATAYRSFDLLRDFRGIIYVPEVTAEDIPTDRPIVPARKK